MLQKISREFLSVSGIATSFINEQCQSSGHHRATLLGSEEIYTTISAHKPLSVALKIFLNINTVEREKNFHLQKDSLRDDGQEKGSSCSEYPTAPGRAACK